MHFLGLSPLHLLSLSILLHAVHGANPIYQTCVKSRTCTSNGTYETNLNLLMASLVDLVPQTGFGLVSVGQEPDRIFGLGLCPGDISSSDCKTCIEDAKTKIGNRCSSDDNEAIIGYDYCLLRYSNEDFSGKVDTKYITYVSEGQNVSDPASFNDKTRELLNQVATHAYQSSKMYATGDLVIDSSEKLYGLAQCTRDLSSASCKKCLDDLISELPSCCDGKPGGRVLGGSCNTRYALYSFVNS